MVGKMQYKYMCYTIYGNENVINSWRKPIGLPMGLKPFFDLNLTYIRYIIYV